MATFTISNGIDGITGALKKNTEQGVNHITVTKKKHFHDPLTREETGTGPNEIFQQNKRDYDKKPLTPGEKKQRGKWQQACCDVQSIIHDKSHPRFMELYNRWRAQLSDPDPTNNSPLSSERFSSVSSRKAVEKSDFGRFFCTSSCIYQKKAVILQRKVRNEDETFPVDRFGCVVCAADGGTGGGIVHGGDVAVSRGFRRE